MAEIALATPDFDRILRDTGVANADAIRVIWLLLQDEINRRERLSQTVGGTTGHNLLSPTHPDTIPDDPVQGDIITALGSTPVDEGKYWLEGEQIIFVGLNEDTDEVNYFLDGDAFLMGGFSTLGGTGTKWQRKALGPAGHFLGSTGTEVDWLPPSTSSESASVYRSTDQAIASATDTAVTLDATHFDTASFWSSLAPTRLTIPTGKGGKYLVVGQLTWADSDIASFHAKIRLNGSTVLAAASENSTITGVTNAPGSHQVVALCDLAAADYIELVAYWSYSTATPRTLQGGSRTTFIQLVKVG